MTKKKSLLCLELTVAGLFSLQTMAQAAENNRFVHESGGYSLDIPQDYSISEGKSGVSSVLLTRSDLLTSQRPVLEINLLDSDKAVNNYDQIIQTIRKARKNRFGETARLLNKKSLRTSHGITGWELSYLQSDSTGQPAVMLYVLLEYDKDRMLVISGQAAAEGRNDFMLLSDRLINSITYNEARN